MLIECRMRGPTWNDQLQANKPPPCDEFMAMDDHPTDPPINHQNINRTREEDTKSTLLRVLKSKISQTTRPTC